MIKLKVKIDKNLEKELGIAIGKSTKPNPKFISDIRRDFSRFGPDVLNKAILADVARGISPVRGLGKFKKYSKSYLAQIRGELDFRTVGGAVIVIKAKRGKKINTHPRQHGKSVSPINMKVTGELWSKLKTTTNKVFNPRNRFTLIVKWEHELADIHNRRGAGKSKVIRRLLPTQSGEYFNMSISRKIFQQLQFSVSKVVNRLS